MRYLIPVVFAVSLQGAVSVTPSTLSFGQAEQFFADFGQQVTINGAGESWSWGTLTGCLFGLGATTILKDTASGTAPTVGVWLRPNGAITYPLSSQVCTGNLPIMVSAVEVAHVTITLTIYAKRTIPTYTNTFGVPDSALPYCINDSALFPDTDYCTPVPEIRPSGTFNLPTGAVTTYVDAVFGATVKNISAPNTDGLLVYYSDQTAMDVGNTRIAATTVTGTNTILNAVTGATVAINTPASIGDNAGVLWSSTLPDTYYIITGNTFQRVSGPSYTATTIYTWGTATTLHNGGSSSMSKDGWTAFDADTSICLINLETATPTAYCGDYTTVSPSMVSNIDFVYASRGTHSVTGKRYAVINGNVYNQVWSYTAGDSSLTFELRMPGYPESVLGGWGAACDASKANLSGCINHAHSAMMETSDGKQLLVGFEAAGSPSRDYIVAFDLGTGDLMSTAAEAGGGMYLMWRMGNTAGAAYHVGCAILAPICTVSTEYFGTSDGITNLPNHIATAGTGNAVPCSLTIPTLTAPTSSTGAAFMSGDSVLCSGAHGNTAINGTWGVTVSGTSMGLDTCTGNGTFSAIYGAYCVLNQTSFRGPHQDEIITIFGLAERIQRVVMPRSPGYAATNSYYSAPRASLSPDGTTIIYNSSGGRGSALDAQIFTVGSGYNVVSTTIRRGILRRGKLR